MKIRHYKEGKITKKKKKRLKRAAATTVLREERALPFSCLLIQGFPT